MIKNRVNILFIISILFWVVSYNIWQYTAPNIYYIGNAQMIMVCSWMIHQKTNSVHHVISRLFLFLAFNNLIDEIFFDPTAVEWNEFVIFALYLIYSLFKWRNSRC